MIIHAIEHRKRKLGYGLPDTQVVNEAVYESVEDFFQSKQMAVMEKVLFDNTGIVQLEDSYLSPDIRQLNFLIDTERENYENTYPEVAVKLVKEWKRQTNLNKLLDEL